MTGRRVCYLLLLAAGGYFMMLYDFQGLRFLFCCIVCIPIACLLLLVPKAFLCRVELETAQDYVTRGETVNICMTIVNKGIVPLSRVFVTVCWSVPGEKEIRQKRLLCGFGRGCEKVTLELDALHCGRAEFRIMKAKVCDYLGLFLLPMKREEAVEVCIVPVITPISEGVIDMSGLSKMMAEERDQDMTVRDYQPGDRLHMVYWKLSAKAGELQVREFEQKDSLTIFLNFSEDFRKRAKEWDRYLDRACSFLSLLAEGNQAVRIMPEVVWRQEGRFWKYDIKDMEALQTWIYFMLMHKGTGKVFAGEENFSPEIFFMQNGCHMEEDCRLYFGEQCVYE